MHSQLGETTGSGRKLLQWGYYGYYDGNGRRWIYWGIPIIIVGVLIFITAIAYYYVRKRRLARTQIPYSGPPPQAAPVTGYPDYTTQYNNDYNHYNSYPQQPAPAYPAGGYPGTNNGGYPGANTSNYAPYQNKPGNVEMNSAAAGYPQRY